MEVKIITKSGFHVLGVEGRGESDKGPEWLKPLWDEAFKRFGEIQHLITYARARCECSSSHRCDRGAGRNWLGSVRCSILLGVPPIG
jgi:hypothetical protein